MEFIFFNRSKIDPRRLPELKDARMIQEDQYAMANCPTQPIHRQFTEAPMFANPYEDDSSVAPYPPRKK